MDEIFNFKDGVSKKWYRCCKLVKKRRKAVSWLSYVAQKEQDQGLSADDQILASLQVLSSQPKHAIIFSNVEMNDFRCRSTSSNSGGTDASDDTRPARKIRSQLISVKDYMKQVLPAGCAIHGTVTDGIVATHWNNVTEEVEESNGILSCVMFPDIPGTDIYGFYEGDARHHRDDVHPPLDYLEGAEEEISNGAVSSEEKRRATLFSRNGTVNAKCLEEVTGIPSDKELRLLLLFEWGYHMSGWSKDLSRAVLQHYGNAVIAGGIVDSFFNERESIEHSVHGVAFCGHADDLQVASVVVPAGVQDPKDVEAKLKLLKDTHLLEKKSVGFLFSCVGRGSQLYDGQENVESGIFRKLFPNTPLFGGFMNGELGMNYLPDYRGGSLQDRGEACSGGDSGNSAESTDRLSASLCHTYSSVVVLLSFKC